ncbi:MAG: hypothetical protein ACR2FZ_01765 [Thermoleophilaceae bacterium]
MAVQDPDHALRVVAHEHVRRLQRAYDGLIPRAALMRGFQFGSERVSLGSFQKGIHRARQQRGPAALSVFTSPKPPYELRAPLIAFKGIEPSRSRWDAA